MSIVPIKTEKQLASELAAFRNLVDRAREYGADMDGLCAEMAIKAGMYINVVQGLAHSGDADPETALVEQDTQAARNSLLAERKKYRPNPHYQPLADVTAESFARRKMRIGALKAEHQALAEARWEMYSQARHVLVTALHDVFAARPGHMLPPVAGNIFGPVPAHIPALAGVGSHRTKPARYTYAFDQDPDFSSWWLGLERALKGNALLNLAEVPNAAICHGAANPGPEFGQVLAFLSTVAPRVAFATTLWNDDIEDVRFVLGENIGGPDIILVIRRKASIYPDATISIEIKCTFGNTTIQPQFDEKPITANWDHNQYFLGNLVGNGWTRKAANVLHALTQSAYHASLYPPYTSTLPPPSGYGLVVSAEEFIGYVFEIGRIDTSRLIPFRDTEPHVVTAIMWAIENALNNPKRVELARPRGAYWFTAP